MNLKCDIQMWHVLLLFMIETRHCTRIIGVSAAPGLKQELRDSRHSSAWFIYEGCHRTDGLGSNTPDNTILSANTALAAYINSSSHPCIPTVRALLAALLSRMFRREVVCSELH